MFGRNMKGVLQLKNNSLEIVNDLEDKVKKKKSKVWYDRKALEVSYDVGDPVLLLLPLVGKPLQAKYRGSYIVEKTQTAKN